MLASRLGSFDGLQFADLFAGSGALGLEALSRGAAACVFVEQDRAALDALRANAAALAIRPDIRPVSVLALPAVGEPCDVVLLDPPYGTGAGLVAIDKLTRLGWIGPLTLVALETARDEPNLPNGFVCDAERMHGKAKITLLRQSRQQPPL